MIYLWTDGKGWTEHELTETDELAKRHIRVGDGARVGARARVGDGAWVGDGARPTIIYIIGSSFPVSYWGEDRIDIGCQQHSIEDWRSTGKEIGAKYQFADAQMEEYSRYIELIAAVHAANPDTAKSRQKED